MAQKDLSTFGQDIVQADAQEKIEAKTEKTIEEREAEKERTGESTGKPAFSRLEYPLGMGDNTETPYRAAIYFIPKAVEGTKFNNDEATKAWWKETFFTLRDQSGDGEGEADTKKEGEAQETKEADNASADKTVPTVTQARTLNPTGDVIKLYLPVALNITDSFSYDTPDLGMLGAATFQGLGKGESLTRATLDAFKGSLKSVSDVINPDMASDVGRVAALRGAQRFAPSEIADAFGLAAAVTVNPNRRSVFRGVAVREFQFTFKFIPRSRAEYEVVQQIIKMFRLYSYPEAIALDEENGVSGGYKYPHMFGIKIVHVRGDGKEQQIGTKILPTHIRSIAVNYNAGSMAFHSEGEPAEIDLSLSLVEERTMSRKDIEGGF